MSWMEQLVQTYNENERFAGRSGVGGMKALLPPVGHIIQNAQIEIAVKGEGKLLHCEVLLKEDQPTLIPCTPDSASRSGKGIFPHPLHDNLSYIARDYGKYATVEQDEKKNPYKQYVKQLKLWAESKYSDPKVWAVYRYVSEHDMIQDLVDKKVLHKDKAGGIIEKWENKDKEKPLIFQATSASVLKCVVRFRVELQEDTCPELWKDTVLQKKYQGFIFQQLSNMGKKLCYASGEYMHIIGKHAKGIRFAGDGAKIISSNDNSGFTFRGRFADSNECISIGYESSQKAMNALSWLIREQGYNVNGRVFLAWGRYQQDLPSTFDNTVRLIQRRWNASSAIPITMREWSDSLKESIQGYRHAFKKPERSQVNVMVLDAATTGRLSICYYDEMAGEDFLKRIEKWHVVSAWWQRGCDEKKKKWYPHYYGVASPRKLISAYRGDNISDAQMKMELHRIFFSIIQGAPLPSDMERTAFQRVVKRAVCDPLEEWEHLILEPTCSIISNRLNYKKEVYTVALNREKTNRSYLFGRLLAVADQMERATFTKEEKGSRTTNAMRYMMKFSSRPSSTWKTLQEKLLPYQEKREKYGAKEKDLMDEIINTFHDEDFCSDAPLKVEFLLGLSCQRYAMKQDNKNEEN